MREIKFRAWDTQNKRIFMVTQMSFRPSNDVFRIWDDTEDFHIENPTDCILMQFTGLHDKNGREIYEGDIVYAPLNQSRYEICIGTYSDLSEDSYIVHYGVYGRRINALSKSYEGMGGAERYVEVIGNIYENPELLEAK